MSRSSRTRQVLTALSAGYLALGAWNSQVYRRTRNLDRPLPLDGERGGYDWPGGRIFYTRRGQGEPVLLVHGIYAGADSHEWRPIFGALADRYQVYAYDLVGFGRSARPNLRYSAAFYARQLADFARNVIGRPATVIASSLSGGHAILAAAEERDLIRRLILEMPTGSTTARVFPGVGAEAAYLALNLLPDLGEAARNVIASRTVIRRYLSNMVYYDRSRVTEDVVERYYRSAHQPGGEHALIAFLTGHLNAPLGDALKAMPQPLALIWGREARVTPLAEAECYLTVRPDAQLRVIEGAGLDAVNEQPQEFLRQTLDVLGRWGVGPAPERPLGEMAAQRV